MVAGAASALLGAARLGPRLRIVLEVLAYGIHPAEQRRAVGGDIQAVEILVERRLVGGGVERNHRAADAGVGRSARPGFVVDGGKADADGLVLAGERLPYRGAHGQDTRAIVLEPVGEVLDFLGISAAGRRGAV
ncbi:hypothetical protein D9M68_703520 [compost metagenome]